MTSADETPVRVGVFGLLGSEPRQRRSLEAVSGTSAPSTRRRSSTRSAADPRSSRPGTGSPRLGCTGTAGSTGPRRVRARSRARLWANSPTPFRTAAWVRRHDVVIVPGMGVLEATLPLRPWGFPYSLFLLCATGRLFGTRVALVSVGAAAIGDRPTRALVRWSARLATYRSYRDALSRDAMRAMGVDTARDEVYPDLAFALSDTGGEGDPSQARRVRSASASWPSTAATTTAPVPRRSTGATSTGRPGSSARWSRTAGRSGCSSATRAMRRWSPRSSTRWTRRWSPPPRRPRWPT